MGAPRVTPQEIVEMHRLYAQLGTYAAVARETGRSASSVSKFVQMKGVPQSIRIAVENLIEQTGKQGVNMKGKRFASLLLAIVLCVGMIPATASAATSVSPKYGLIDAMAWRAVWAEDRDDFVETNFVTADDGITEKSIHLGDWTKDGVTYTAECALGDTVKFDTENKRYLVSDMIAINEAYYLAADCNYGVVSYEINSDGEYDVETVGTLIAHSTVDGQKVPLSLTEDSPYLGKDSNGNSLYADGSTQFIVYWEDSQGNGSYTSFKGVNNLPGISNIEDIVVVRDFANVYADFVFIMAPDMLSDRYTIPFSSLNETVSITWKDDWFAKSSAVYRHDLAISSMALAQAAYVSDGKGVQTALATLGFDAIISYNYDYPLTVEDNDVVGYTFAKKEKVIRFDNKSYDLVAVIVKGTSGNEEWYSNFNIGVDSTHRGFTLAKDDLMTKLKTYADEQGLQKETTKFLVTGHSRGAAVANMVAAELNNSTYAKQFNVYAYTFATPSTTTASNRNGTDYLNIFNIISGEDFVTQVPLQEWKYGHYGVDLMLPSRSYYDSANYNNVLYKMECVYERLAGKNFDVYPNGTQDVRNVCEKVYKLAATPTKYYSKYYFSLGSNSTLMSTYEYFRVIATYLINHDVTILGVVFSSASKFFPITCFFVNDNYINDRIFSAHSGAAYYSWMSSCTAEELFGNYNYESGNTFKKLFKTLRVACPVDVYVYDESGKLVASVVDEAVVENILAVSVEDGVKTIDLPNDQNYSVEVKATGDGTMTYTVEELTATATGVTKDRTVSFNDVAIQTDDVLSAEINDQANTAVLNYTLTKNGTSVIHADYDSAKTSTSGNSSSSKPSASTDNNTTSNPFVDVPDGKYFTDAVLWAVENGITGGKDATHFDPYASCTRGQLVTFLWRAAGKPEAKNTENFPDVAAGRSCEKAILWAAENGIVTGYSDGTFRPDATVTRQQVAAILWRYAKAVGMEVSVGEDTNILSFHDALSVSEYAAPAFQWAVGAGVLQGNDGNLMPYNTCTRAQIVTMLYRLLAK